jgi:cob(I)alamin adenosyltransferase
MACRQPSCSSSRARWETGERDLIEKHFGDVCQFYTLGEGFTWETQDRAQRISPPPKKPGKKPRS